MTGERTTRKKAGCYSRTVIGKLAAATTIYKGALVAKNAAGYCVPAADTAGLVVVGVAMQTVVNPGAAGALEINIDVGGVYKFFNLAADPVVQADMHGIVRVGDDQSVRNAGGTADIIAGVCELIEPDGVWVHVDGSINLALAS